MQNKLILSLIICASLIGCTGIPLVTYDAAELQHEKYLYETKHYPHKTVEQLQMQLSSYKTRCGLIHYIASHNSSLTFEKISEKEYVMFVHAADGISTVLRANEADDVQLTIWTRTPRIAKYMLNAIETGQCKSSVWD